MHSFTDSMTVLLLVFLVQPLQVLCDRLLPGGTSYGFVPRDTALATYPRPAAADWKPFSKFFDEMESRKRKTTDEDGYRYNNSQYLPPMPPEEDSFPTLPPTDEEFINRPNHDEAPPSLPFGDKYYYPRPEIPFDELLPPAVPHDEPASQYLPAVEIAKKSPIHMDSSSELDRIDARQSSSREHPLHIEVTEMNCFEAGPNGRFQAVLTIQSPNENIPIFEDATDSSCSVESEHNPPRMNSKFRFNIFKNQFEGCAVKDCSSGADVVHLCVRLRFPTIARMRLLEDPILTLQCRTQDRIAAHTKHLQLDVDSNNSVRSNTIARGGTRKPFRSRVSLYRSGIRGDFTEALLPKAKVSLGEMLMLRTEVDSTGGWSAARLSSVGLSSLRGGSTLSILGSDGCRTPKARILCPKEPHPTSPLAHTLLMRAAMFEGMKSGDEVRLSVRVIACLDAGDCTPQRCGQGHRTRTRRSVNQTEDYTSQLSWQVFLPEDSTSGIPTNKTPIILIISLLSLTIISSSFLLVWRSKR